MRFIVSIAALVGLLHLLDMYECHTCIWHVPTSMIGDSSGDFDLLWNISCGTLMVGDILLYFDSL